MFQDRCYDRDTDINNNFFADNMTNNIDIDVNNGMQGNTQMAMGTMQRPLVEPMQERCVHRQPVHSKRKRCKTHSGT